MYIPEVPPLQVCPVEASMRVTGDSWPETPSDPERGGGGSSLTSRSYFFLRVQRETRGRRRCKLVFVLVMVV